MFGRKKEEESPPKGKESAPIPTKEEFEDSIRSILDKEIERHHDLAPKKLEGYQNEYQSDINTYRFHARRWGDFLSFDFERLGKKTTRVFNLQNVSELGLMSGMAPKIDNISSVYYNNSGGYSSWLGASPKKSWPEEYAILTTILQEELKLIVVDNSYPYAHFQGIEVLSVKSLPLAQRPVDDRLVFNGIKSELWVPAGMGELVRNDILQALKDGYEPSKSSILDQ